LSENINVDSKLYDKAYFEQTDGADYFYKGEIAPKFLRAINAGKLTTGQKVLDIGCGRGDLTIALARSGAEVVGVDYSEDAVKIACDAVKKLDKDIAEKISIVQSDAAALDFPDEVFDSIYMLDIVEHLYPQQLFECFGECFRILKPNGSLIVHTSPNRWYNDFGYPFWERPINIMANALFRQNLLTRPIRTETDLKVHINEQTVLSLKKYFTKADFKAEIWLGREYVIPAKKESAAMSILETARQAICHLYPLSLYRPLNFLFSNDIWAVGRKKTWAKRGPVRVG
jgi:cyclopropane fatty-acyl-phospholipid synthase-like methyltransferase